MRSFFSGWVLLVAALAAAGPLGADEDRRPGESGGTTVFGVRQVHFRSARDPVAVSVEGLSGRPVSVTFNARPGEVRRVTEGQVIVFPPAGQLAAPTKMAMSSVGGTGEPAVRVISFTAALPDIREPVELRVERGGHTAAVTVHPASRADRDRSFLFMLPEAGWLSDRRIFGVYAVPAGAASATVPLFIDHNESFSVDGWFEDTGARFQQRFPPDLRAGERGPGNRFGGASRDPVAGFFYREWRVAPVGGMLFVGGAEYDEMEAEYALEPEFGASGRSERVESDSSTGGVLEVDLAAFRIGIGGGRGDWEGRGELPDPFDPVFEPPEQVTIEGEWERLGVSISRPVLAAEYGSVRFDLLGAAEWHRWEVEGVGRTSLLNRRVRVDEAWTSTSLGAEFRIGVEVVPGIRVLAGAGRKWHRGDVDGVADGLRAGLAIRF